MSPSRSSSLLAAIAALSAACATAPARAPSAPPVAAATPPDVEEAARPPPATAAAAEPAPVPKTAAVPVAPDCPKACKTERGAEALLEGCAAMHRRELAAAVAAYERCLRDEPGCVDCRYERGWAHWSRNELDLAIRDWEAVVAADPGHALARQWLAAAKERQRAGKDDTWVPIGTPSAPADAPVRLALRARFQSYQPRPKAPDDRYDTDVYSPKSVRFSADGARVYVNSLEGMKTVVYDARTLAKLGAIEHRFGAAQAPLFAGLTTAFDYAYNPARPAAARNVFGGKPVESALSHGGKYLWVPYYRRDFDATSSSPSAIAVIDTATDAIVRVLPTGPIPKYVAISPDGKLAAITHWGDNTVALLDISSDDPAKFAYRGSPLVVEHALSLKGLQGKDRDSACGFCLRGTVFAPDGATLLVARMAGGGVAGFDVATGAYLGTVTGERPTPRHLVVSKDGRWLWVSSNSSGYVSRVELARVVEALRGAGGKRVALGGWQEVRVGGGARTIALSPDERFVYAACNATSELVVVSTETMSVVARIRTDSFTVGLAVSPDGSQVWTTSQGRRGRGGNSVCVYSVEVAEPKPAGPPAPPPKAAATPG